jgi:pimeloyl-ACP methyl ester carboxylesterase
MGFKVISYDYRGYGESSDFVIDNEYYIYAEFIQDFKAVVDHFKAEANSLYLYGWGIGATLNLGTGFSIDGIQAIVADTPIGSLESLQNKSLKVDPNFSPEHNPQKALEKKPGADLKGVFLLIGSDEKLVELDELNRLRKLQKKLIKEVHVVPNPDQKDNFRVDKAAYMAAIREFLED